MPVLTKINTNVIADDAVTAAKTSGTAEQELTTSPNINLSGTVSAKKLQLGEAFTLTDDLTITGDLVLGKIRDDGTGQSLTGDGKTITGTGTLTMGSSFEGEPKNRNDEIINQAFGSTVIGTLGSGVTFPAGHVLQVRHYETTEVNALTTSYVNYWENNITLKSASSDIFVTCSFNAWIWNSGAMGMKIYRSTGGEGFVSVTTSDTAVFTKNTVDGTGPLTMFFNAGSGEISFVQTFSGQDVITGRSAGDVLYYALFMRKRNSNNVSVGNNYTEDGWMSMDLMEVQK